MSRKDWYMDAVTVLPAWPISILSGFVCRGFWLISTQEGFEVLNKPWLTKVPTNRLCDVQIRFSQVKGRRDKLTQGFSFQSLIRLPGEQRKRRLWIRSWTSLGGRCHGKTQFSRFHARTWLPTFVLLNLPFVCFDSCEARYLFREMWLWTERDLALYAVVGLFLLEVYVA